jgi:hypothetical protein
VGTVDAVLSPISRPQALSSRLQRHPDGKRDNDCRRRGPCASAIALSAAEAALARRRPATAAKETIAAIMMTMAPINAHPPLSMNYASSRRPTASNIDVSAMLSGAAPPQPPAVRYSPDRILFVRWDPPTETRSVGEPRPEGGRKQLIL